MHNNDLIEKTTSVLDKMMNFFKKVMNKQTMTDKGPLHHTADLEPGTEVYNSEDLDEPAVDDIYTTADGQQLTTKNGKVEKVEPAAETADDDEEKEVVKAKGKVKPHDVQNQVAALKAKLHAQNALLTEARNTLQSAQTRLQQTHTQVKNEIKSTYTPEGSKRSNKATTETQPFFAPQSAIAQNAVKQAVNDSK